VRRALAQLARLDPTRLDLTLPRPWVCVLLVAAFLGFGALLGRVSSSSDTALSASVHPQLRLILPQASEDSAGQVPPPDIASTPTPTAGSSEAAPETPSESGDESGASSGGSSGAKGTATSPGAGAQKSGSDKGASGQAGSGDKGNGGGSGGGGGGKESGGGGESGSGSSTLPPVKHVFVIMLSDQPYASVFGPSSGAPYLAKTLERRGELLVRYYGVAHDELANEIALVSGQGPTPQTEVNCPTYADVAPATPGADGQVLGQGCVYPASTETLAGQLSAKHLTWRAYVEGASAEADSAAGESQIGGGCTHPTLGAADPTVDQTLPAAQTPAGPTADQAPTAYEATAGTAYATFRNPFLYFHSVIDGSACTSDDVGIDRLTADLASAHGAPSLSYIVPSLCDDGDPTPCAPGRPAGLAPAESFLHRIVPRILASKSYKHGGLLVITVDQAPSSGVYADSSSCCDQPAFPALPPPPALPGGGTARPTGGGQVGALLLSPYVKPGTTSEETFNHFSLLRTIEDLFGLAHLGYAALPKVEAFGASVFNAGG
jgi:phosphatidylinositol-3-phosphatase